MEGIQLTISKRDQHSNIYADHARLKKQHSLLIAFIGSGFTSDNLKAMSLLEWRIFTGAAGTHEVKDQTVHALIEDMAKIESIRAAREAMAEETVTV